MKRLSKQSIIYAITASFRDFMGYKTADGHVFMFNYVMCFIHNHME